MWHALTAQEPARKSPYYQDFKGNGRRPNGNGRRYGH